MEDINAKRDARRRRILENSEKRLLKITGREGNTESEDTSSQTSFLKDVQKESKQSTINGTIADECSNRITNADDFNFDDTIWNCTSASESMHNDMKKETKDIHDTCTETKYLPILSLSNRVNYILLAVIINVLLALDLDHLFGKSVAIPCFPVILGRMYMGRDRWDTQDGNLFYTALILCNIKPKLTYQFKRFVALTHLILGDLALYIFSFTLVHYGLFYCYLHRTDIVTISSV